MKAREIKKMYLERYNEEIHFYEQAKEDVRRREERIRVMQDDLKMYFGVIRTYDFNVDM